MVCPNCDKKYTSHVKKHKQTKLYQDNTVKSDNEIAVSDSDTDIDTDDNE